MCLMFLMRLPVTLVLMSELLLVRCKLAGLLACKRPRQGLAKGPLVKQTRHQRMNEPVTVVTVRYGHGSAKGRVRVDV